MADEFVTSNQVLDYDAPEPLLNALAEIFAFEGGAREVGVLAESTAKIYQTGYDNWDGGIYLYCLQLTIPKKLYSQILEEKGTLETSICNKAREIFEPGSADRLTNVLITPQLSSFDPEWRNKSKAWLAGEGVSNQGRVRSNDIAPKTLDGLLFRSQAEINFYLAIKSEGVSFAPLPVFIRGGESYRRIEPDFILVKDGFMTQVEIDGDTYHHETPAEAHERTAMLYNEGVYVERVKASECKSLDGAKLVAKRVIGLIEKRKNQR